MHIYSLSLLTTHENENLLYAIEIDTRFNRWIIKPNILHEKILKKINKYFGLLKFTDQKEYSYCDVESFM